MSSNMDSVHIGHWINHAKGEVLGSTITLPNMNGVFLTAFLAIYITWVGGHAWGILCFFAHQRLSTVEPRDGLHHQRQVSLRNGAAVGASLWSFSKIAWAWRKASSRPIFRMLPVILMALVHLAAFSTAGILSSRITEAGEEVLLKPTKCGVQTNPFLNDPQTQRGDNSTFIVDDTKLKSITAYYTWSRAVSSSGLDYAKTCYNDPGTSKGSGRRCQDYARPIIGTYQTRDVECPFNNTLCALETAFQVDTGFISSNKDLGINNQPGDCLWFRKVTTWAPINLEDRFTIDDDGMRTYELGTIGTGRNFTFAFSMMSGVTGGDRNRDMYTLSAYNYHPLDGNRTAQYTPIPELFVADADITMLRFDSTARYTSRVEDPIFLATQSINFTDYFAAVYAPDDPVTVMGLVEQYQMCTEPNEATCGPLTSLDAMYNSNATTDLNNSSSFKGVALSTDRWSLAHRISDAMALSSIGTMVKTLGAPVLVAESSVWGDTEIVVGMGLSGGLPPDHWKAEASNFHNISLAMLQQHMLERVSPSSLQTTAGDASTEPVYTNDFVTPDDARDAVAMRLCNAQKARSFKFSSFSVLGIGIIIGVGTTIIIINCCLSEIVAWWRMRRNPAHRYKTLEWISSATLQLQRAAFEAKGIEPWVGKDDAVPLPHERGLKWTSGEVVSYEERPRRGTWFGSVWSRSDAGSTDPFLVGKNG